MNKNELKKLDIEALVKLATEKGVTVPDGASKKDVIDLIVVAEKASKPENKTTSNEPKKDVIYYLLKVKCFVSSTETWQKGLYRVTRPIARLDGSSKEYVERFDGTIPETSIMEIAKMFGVSTHYYEGNKHVNKKPEEILNAVAIDK